MGNSIRPSAGTTKEKKMSKSLMITIALVAVLAAGTALAQQRMNGGERGGRGFERGPRIERLAERLGLTDEQKTAIEALHEETRAKNAALAKETRLLRHELEGELLKDEPSEKKVLELNAKLGDLNTERQATRLATRLAVRNQLTPEQRDKMLAMGPHHGRGPRGEGPGGGSGRGMGRGGRGGCDGSCGGRGQGRGAW
jgi:Spy/CpxP family protein refolding chaperone